MESLQPVPRAHVYFRTAAVTKVFGETVALWGVDLVGRSGDLIAAHGALRRFRRLAAWLSERRRPIDVVTGTLVVGVGVLVFTGAFARLAGLFTFGVV